MSQGLYMSIKELERLKVMEQIRSGVISQKMASGRLSVGVRQIKRLYARYKALGAKGPISGHRGKASNPQLPASLKDSVLSTIRLLYSDFGPTLAAEYLSSAHNIKVSVETVRRWMIEAGLWSSKKERKVRIYQQRERRAQFGELIQLDGSHHDWFEGRADKCCLLVLIDDATSAILGLHFIHAETTQGYFELMHRYIETYGLPMALYSDQHSVFRKNQANIDPQSPTQFARAMGTLGVELINASTPQAKGRVEKANRTLQDRLVKALRLESISDMKSANEFLPQFIEQYNEKFAKPPKEKNNAHCPIALPENDLLKILSIHTHRKLSKALECSYQNKTLQISSEKHHYRLHRKPILVTENYKSEINLFYKDNKLEFQILNLNSLQPKIHNDKTINQKLDSIKKNRKTYTPPKNHPWRHFKIKNKKKEVA